MLQPLRGFCGRRTDSSTLQIAYIVAAMNPLIITLGDPAGIGPEVVLEASSQAPELPAVLCGSWEETIRVAQRLGLSMEAWRRIPEPSLAAPGTFLDIGNAQGPVTAGSPSAESGRLALAAIEAGISLMKEGRGSALVTAPVSKEAIVRSGASFTGHTELLAERTGRSRYGRDFAMYFESPSLRVVLLTVHVPLADAIRQIDPTSIAELASLSTRELRRLGLNRCRIAVAGVNPHAGEGGLFGTQEQQIAEGVSMARHAGLDVHGPFPADTVFHQALRGSFDLVMAIYHDQGLIPIKTLDFERSVNVTLGLPWLRVSVDHGTAFDIAGKGVADAGPMTWALRWAADRSST